MDITHLGHASLLIQTAGARILIDPGAFSNDWHGLTDVDAVLVTHQHPDHLDPTHLIPLLTANRRAQLLVEPSAAELLPGDLQARAFAPGDTATVGDVQITGVGGRHAVIHPEMPTIGNVGMVLRGEGEPALFHPGDSYTAIPPDIDIAAVPVNAPWAKLDLTVAFLRDVDPVRWIPIHDGLLNERGRMLYVNRIADLSPAALLDLAGNRRATI